MDRNLFFQAVAKFSLGFFTVMGLLFLSAGTFAYRNAWLFAALLFVPMFAAGVVMMFKSPQLLRKRLQAKESEPQQRHVVAFSGGMFVLGFLLAGLDYRFQWTPLPHWTLYPAAILFVLAYLLYGEVLRENAYLSRTVEVQEGQTVIDTGLYGFIRHPMYAATVLLFLSIPLVLGSAVSFIVFLAYPVLIVTRIRNEEAVLLSGLPGYSSYMERVKYRLLPFVW